MDVAWAPSYTADGHQHPLYAKVRPQAAEDLMGKAQALFKARGLVLVRGSASNTAFLQSELDEYGRLYNDPRASQLAFCHWAEQYP